MEEHVVEKNEGFDNTRFELMGEWELKNLLFTYGGDDSNAPHGELVERVRVLWLERQGKPRGPPPANLFRRSPWVDKDPPEQRVSRPRAAYLGWSGHETLPWASSRSRSRSRSRERSPRRSASDSPPRAVAPDADDLLAAATAQLSVEAENYFAKKSTDNGFHRPYKRCAVPPTKLVDAYTALALNDPNRVAIDAAKKIVVVLEEMQRKTSLIAGGTLTSNDATEFDALLGLLDTWARAQIHANISIPLGVLLEIGAPPLLYGFIGDVAECRAVVDELKDLEEALAECHHVELVETDHYEALAILEHARLADEMRRQNQNDCGSISVVNPVVIKADAPLPFPLIAEAAKHGAVRLKGSDPVIFEKYLLTRRQEFLLEHAPEANCESKCPGCSQFFGGLERIEHLRKSEVCRKTLIYPLLKGKLFVCDGKCPRGSGCTKHYLSAKSLSRHKEGAPEPKTKRGRVLSRDRIRNRVPLKLEDVDSLSWNEASDYAGAMGTRHRATGTKRNDFREACKLWFVGRETEEFVPSLDVATRERRNGVQIKFVPAVRQGGES